MDRCDVAIVGGGAAGVGAARRLAASGLDVLLIEALARIGGRARTEHVGGLALDLGCGWLHSADRNPWVRIAEEGGFAIDRTESAWREQYRQLGFSKAEQKDAAAAFEAFGDRLRYDPPASDHASDTVPPDERWRPYLESLSTYINGAELAQLSVADYLAYDDAASETNWRLPGGYGALVAASLPRQVPLALATPVTRIDGSGVELSIGTERGTIAARAAIVTVSSNVLASGAIRFDAGLDGQLHAASRLPLGVVDKLFLAVVGAEELDPDSHLLGNPYRARTGSYYLRPFGMPVIECFLGGEEAQSLEREGLEGAAAFAIDELAALLGSGWRKRLRLIAGSRWGEETFVRGSYSHALPGEAGARAVLREAIDPRLVFAGEACSASDFSTAHGAYDTGVAAAERVIAELGARG